MRQKKNKKYKIKKSYTNTLYACHRYTCLQIIMGFSAPSRQSKNRAHHRRQHALQAPPSALVHRPSTTSRTRRTHRIRTGSGFSCGPPTGSDSRLGSACPRVRPPSPCAWHRRAPADRARRAGGRSSGSGERILVWPSRALVCVFCLVSSDRRERVVIRGAKWEYEPKIFLWVQKNGNLRDR